MTKSSEMANTSKCPINSYASFIACCSPMRITPKRQGWWLLRAQPQQPWQPPAVFQFRRNCGPPLSHLNACVAPRRHFLPSSCISWHCIQRCMGRVPCNRAQLPALLTATLQPTFRNIARFNKHHITSGRPLVGMRRTAGRTHRGRLPWASLMPRAQECAASTATEE